MQKSEKNALFAVFHAYDAEANGITVNIPSGWITNWPDLIKLIGREAEQYDRFYRSTHAITLWPFGASPVTISFRIEDFESHEGYCELIGAVALKLGLIDPCKGGDWKIRFAHFNDTSNPGHIRSRFLSQGEPAAPNGADRDEGLQRYQAALMRALPMDGSHAAIGANATLEARGWLCEGLAMTLNTYLRTIHLSAPEDQGEKKEDGDTITYELEARRDGPHGRVSWIAIYEPRWDYGESRWRGSMSFEIIDRAGELRHYTITYGCLERALSFFDTKARKEVF